MERLDTTSLPFKLDGNFSEQASYPHQIFQDFTQFISDSFDKLIPPEGQPCVIGDFGTADGGASFPIIKHCIRRLRQKFGDSIPIQIVYEDQPVNDFRPVFLRANELCKEFQNVYVTVSGTSFYQQCCPDNSLDFILSSCATHLLSRCPMKMATELICELAPPKELAVFRKQAEDDWELFLLQRSRELKPGGYMVLINCQKGEITQMGFVTELWKSMVSDDIITQTEFRDTNFMSWCRTPEEIRKPFGDETSRVSRAGLVLVAEQTSTVPITEDVDKDTTLHSVTDTYVKNLTRTTRSWSELTLFNALGSKRTETEKRAIMETFYQRLSDHLRASPERVGFGGLRMFGIAVQKLNARGA